MSKYYHCPLGFRVNWQLDGSLIREVKSEKRANKLEKESEKEEGKRKRTPGKRGRKKGGANKQYSNSVFSLRGIPFYGLDSFTLLLQITWAVWQPANISRDKKNNNKTRPRIWPLFCAFGSLSLFSRIPVLTFSTNILFLSKFGLCFSLPHNSFSLRWVFCCFHRFLISPPFQCGPLLRYLTLCCSVSPPSCLPLALLELLQSNSDHIILSNTPSLQEALLSCDETCLLSFQNCKARAEY